MLQFLIQRLISRNEAPIFDHFLVATMLPRLQRDLQILYVSETASKTWEGSGHNRVILQQKSVVSCRIQSDLEPVPQDALIISAFPVI